jgi:hypothetical protein
MQLPPPVVQRVGQVLRRYPLFGGAVSPHLQGPLDGQEVLAALAVERPAALRPQLVGLVPNARLVSRDGPAELADQRLGHSSCRLQLRGYLQNPSRKGAQLADVHPPKAYPADLLHACFFLGARLLTSHRTQSLR